MKKCTQVSCKENAITNYKSLPVCGYHYKEYQKADLNYSSGGNTEDGYEDCDYCRGAYDKNGNYDPKNGKAFGRFNKKTKECDNEMCDHHSWKCKCCPKKVKGKKIGGTTPYGFCSAKCKKNAEEAEEKRRKKQEEEFSKPCSQCGGILGDNYYYDQTGQRQGKFCSQVCYQKIYKDNLEKIKQLKNSMKNWEDISSYDWKNADWLDERDKEICHEYEKNRQQREKLKQEGKDYSNQTNKSDKIDDEKIPTLSTSNNNSSNSQNNSSFPNSPFNSNRPSEDNRSSISCPMCEKTWVSEDEHDSRSPNCQRLMEIGKKFQKNIEEGKFNDISDLKELPKKFQTYLIALQDLKLSEKKINIDELDLPEDAKQELRKIRGGAKRKYVCGNCRSDLDKDVSFDSQKELDKHMRDHNGFGQQGAESKPPILPKILIGAGLVLIFIIILVVIIKKKKKSKKKLNKT